MKRACMCVGLYILLPKHAIYCLCRPPDDSFWADREKQLIDIRKKEAIAALDPLGASVHLAAERCAKEAATSSMFKVFIANLVLQALQVELHDASTELYSNDPDCCKSLYSLTLTSLALEEGYGLVGAFVRRLANISKKANYSLIKLCFVENLGLRLTTLKELSGQLKPADLSDGLDGIKSHENSVEYCVLLWKSVLLSTGFQNGKLNGIDASFTETVIQFSPAEAEAILSTIGQLQGSSRALHTTLSEETQRPSKGARYLWQRAFEKVTGGSWRKFRGAVEAGLLRQRYSQLYASWLLKAGEGICNETGLLSIRKGSKRKKDVLISLERDLYRLEQELPIEAIVLARFFGRNRALIDSKKLVMTAQPLGSVLWSRAILCLFAFWRTIQTLSGTLARMLKSFFNVLNNFVKQLPFVSGIQWLLLRCAKDISSLCCRRFHITNVPTGSDIRHPHLPAAAFSEGLDNNRLLRFKHMRGRTYFKGTFHMGSVTFIGSMECFTRNHGRKLFTRSGMNILGGNNLPGVRFAFGNLSVIHSSQAMALSFELVCGYLKGQVVTVPFGRSDRDTDKKTQGGILHIEKDGTEFLQSGPAPQIQLPENFKNNLGSCEKAVSNFLNFLGKEMVLVSKDPEEAPEINVRPFIVCSCENTQTSYPLPGRNVDSMMCSLAVGCVTCKLDLETYGVFGMLVVQLLDIVNANRQPINSDEGFKSNSAASTSIAAGSDWEVLYSDQIRQFVSAVVLKKELWLSLALAGPKIEFSGFFLRSPRAASKTRDGGVSYDPVFLMDFGLLEVTVWPAMAEQINCDDTLEQPFLGARNRKVWLMKLPSPNIQGNEVVQGRYEHEEIGNNGIVSLHGTAISLGALSGPEKNELVGPLNLLWRFSICRDHFISPFGVCNILSAAVMGSCSPIQVEILFEELELLLEGGLFFLHTEALLMLLQELRRILSSKKVSMETESGELVLSPYSNIKSKDEGLVLPPNLGRSMSLPLRQPQERQFHRERLYSAPFESSIIDVHNAAPARSENCMRLPEDFHAEISGLCFVLAQNRVTSSGKEQGALLLEVGGNFKLQTSVMRQTLMLETTSIRLSIFSEGKDSGGMTGQLSRIPRFGSSFALHTGVSGGINIKENTLLNDDGEMTTKTGHLVSVDSEKNLSKGLIAKRENDYILENLSISLKLENHFGYLRDSNGWSGSCVLLGLDIGITIPEVQLLLGLISSISSVPQPFVKDESNELKDLGVTPSKPISDNAFQIPDGSIVAVKDVQEHLYMAVEKANNNSYRLICVLHYSLVGDRALFKVKYQKKSRDNSQMWFSLLSVGARNTDGEPFRIHYRPGSGLADISSTHDGSWELWQAHPYKYSSKAVNGDIDLYSDLNRNLVHLVNQKSKQGLTLATGAPVMVKQPGSPFKFKVLQSGVRIQPFLPIETQNLIANTQESKIYPSGPAAAIPQVDLKVGRIIFTLLHESGGGKYLIPLLRGSIEDNEAVMHVQPLKIRFIGGCKFVFEYFEGYVNQWSMIIQPMEIGLFYRMRIGGKRNVDRVKLPMSFFARCKRVDITVSEKSLDIILFVIGILKLAGPYSIKYSPVLATSCLVQNNTGLDLCCSFDNHEGKEVVKIPAWRTDTFFVRNLISRRDLLPAKTLSSVSFNLEKGGVGLTSPILASLLEPSLTAIRTRLERVDGHKKTTGPIVVVEVSKQSQDGVVVTVSPMTRIHNCSGLSIELRCRRPSSDFEGASVSLKDGDIVDDSMGTFDALSLKGELRKALSSFGLGDYLLSVRPVGPVPADSVESPNDAVEENEFDWSEDIKGAKPIHVSGFFEKLQYGFKKSLIGQNASHSFGTVFCALNFKKDAHGNASKSSKGMHILIRFTSRYVPLVSVNSNDKPDGSRPIVAWQEQKELVLLPTLCIHNYLDMKISFSSKAGQPTFDYHISIESSCKVSLFADLTELVFAISLDELGLASKDISMREWSRSVHRSTAGSDSVKEMELDLDFGDNWCARLKMFRANDGVLQVVVYSQYAVKNSSDIALLFCMPKQSGFLWKMLNTGRKKVQWPSGEVGTILNSGGRMSLLKRSPHLLLRMAERLSETASLDLDSLSGSTELSLKIFHEDGLIEETQLGVRMEVTATGNTDPTHTINIGSRYVVFNDSQEAILICQDGLQDDETAAIFLKTGEHISLKTQFYPGPKQSGFGYSQLVGSDTAKSSVFSIRFRFQQNDWDWTGPVCASSLGSFSLRVHKRLDNLSVGDTVETRDETIFKFISVDVEDRSPSLIIRFQIQSADAAPYRIENLLPQASIFFYQKGLSDVVTTLEPRKIVSYAWDNLSQPHKLVVGIHGTQLNNEIKLDKLGPWKSFRAFRQKRLFDLHLPFENQSDFNVPTDIANGNPPLSLDPMKVGYEIGADGFQRVLRVCEDVFSSKLTKWQSHVSFPSARMDFRVPVFGITLVENLKHQKDNGASRETSDGMYRMSPIISMRLSNLFCEVLNTQKYFLFQLKVETLSVDERWEGAPFSAMLRVHSEDRFKKGETVLHMAAIVSNQASNPIHVKYSSILLQTIDVNLDEETLMKLVPFYRYSLAESTSSWQLYFERFEIHPIKIIASFIPGQPLADYTSMQETFRTLLHSFIKVPSLRGSTVELNGVLLTHALMTFRQMAIKCAQHYSWYALRAVYLVKGSKLLPPAFTSLFDDSAASSLDVFFDPSNGSIDLQGLTLGMFNFLSDGLKNRGFSGTSRYIGDLERTMKTAGSNILFAILTEVSDNVLKGAETGGLEGMVNGFRRGILNVSMEPSLLRTAVVKGGSSRRIKLDNSAGTDETYVEGYLQAMLDTLYQQHYLKVKVVDDEVLLKNLPPNSALVDEIMGSVKSFLVREGLLAGETSAAPLQSWRRLQGENDKRIVPAVAALCEQLFVIFAVRALRNQARSWLNSSGIANSTWNRFFKKEGEGKGQPDTEERQEKSRGMKGILFSFVISSAMAYIDGRLCRHIPNTLARRVVSGFLLSFVE